MNLFNTILNWSEVWALLIPLAIYLLYRPTDNSSQILGWYLFVAIILNGLSTTSFVFNESMPAFLKNNNIFYNTHSIARVIFFSWFIQKITPKQFSFINKILLPGYLIFAVVNFIFFENILFFSSRLFAAESVVLLFLCIAYFLRSIQDETVVNWTSHPSFLVCTGIVIYEAITFFIFLFILPLADRDPEFGLLSLKIYKMTFVLLCTLIAIAFYRSKQIELKGKKQV